MDFHYILNPPRICLLDCCTDLVGIPNFIRGAVKRSVCAHILSFTIYWSDTSLLESLRLV